MTCNKNEGNKIAIPVLTPDRIHKSQNGRRMKEDGDPAYTVTAQEPQGVAIGFVNAHDDGTCRTIKSQYQRNSMANFVRCDALGATAVCVNNKSALKSGFETARDGEDSINLSYPTSNTRRGRVGVGVAQTLDTKCEQGVAVVTGQGEELPGGGQMYGIKPQENVDTIYYPKGDCQIAIRKLTPKECFRLQAVPDELFERAKFVNSDAQLYKQAGNAVTATVVYELAKKLTKGQKRQK